MFCPKCRAEYVQGVSRCADCDIALVAQLPEPEPEAEYIELLTVGSFLRPMDWIVAKSLLDDAGIEYFARNEGVVGLYGAPVPGPIEVQVRPEDAETVRELLKQMDQAGEGTSIFPDDDEL